MEMQGDRVAAHALCRSTTERTPAEIAEAWVDSWRRMESALAPVLGLAGVRALQQRGVQLSVERDAWLATGLAGRSAPIDLAALTEAVARGSSAEAALACDTLLEAIETLLSDLIGVALAERLLRPSWSARSTLDAPHRSNETPR
jgi:hypothetical protein